jgi:hypothetical protein
MPSTFTVNKGIEQPSAGSYNDTWATPVNQDWQDIDNALAGNTQISVTGVAGGIYTLSLAEYQPPNIIFTGVLEAAIDYAFPPGVGWLGTLFNNTSGAFPLKIAGGGGASIVLPQGQRTSVVCDGTNIDYTSTPITSANPSALVGLSAIDGVAETFMTSDSAPALNQSISPTWTGNHTFDGSVTTNGHTVLAALTTVGVGVTFDGTSGIVEVLTQAPGDNSSKAASTAFVTSAFADSPVLGGIPEATTPSPGDNSTRIATTAFVETAIAAQAAVLITKGGLTPSLSGGANTITFPTRFPTACVSVVVTPYGSSATYAITSFNETQFTMNTGDAEPFTWIAIGY